MVNSTTIFKVDKIRPDDLPALADLYNQLVDEKTDREKIRTVFAKMDAHPDYYLLGAKADAKRLVGSIMGIICLDLLKQGRPFMTMENLIVDTHWRGQGVGRLLLSELEHVARKRDCLFIQFCSSSLRKEAHKFYRNCGYDLDEAQGFRKFL